MKRGRIILSTLFVIVACTFLLWDVSGLSLADVGESGLYIRADNDGGEERIGQLAKLEVPFSSEGEPSRAYYIGNPTDKEQYMLELINRGRANPLAEIKRIIAENDPDVRSAMETYKISVSHLIEEFSSYKPVPPLAFNTELMLAAHRHDEDMLENDFQGHIGSDGSTLKDRLEAVGYEYKAAGENVFAYAKSVEHGHAAFWIDWGVEDLGHRKNELDLIDGSDFREIGIAILAENLPGTSVGPLVIAENFGRSYSGVVFITGVVYRDVNNNDFYDAGEGLSEVTVMPDHGTYYAITSSSGGYAIPVIINSGKYELRIIRSDLPELRSSVTILGENVKQDFKLGDPNFGILQGQVIDKDTNRPLANVVITLKPINAQYTTGSDGKFIFSDLPAANYLLCAERDGYIFAPKELGITLDVGENKRIKLEAELSSSGKSGKNTQADSENVGDDNGNDNNNMMPIGSECSGPGLILMLGIYLSFRMLLVRDVQ